MLSVEVWVKVVMMVVVVIVVVMVYVGRVVHAVPASRANTSQQSNRSLENWYNS